MFSQVAELSALVTSFNTEKARATTLSGLTVTVDPASPTPSNDGDIYNCVTLLLDIDAIQEFVPAFSAVSPSSVARSASPITCTLTGVNILPFCPDIVVEGVTSQMDLMKVETGLEDASVITVSTASLLYATSSTTLVCILSDTHALAASSANCNYYFRYSDVIGKISLYGALYPGTKILLT
jgi:hypothetical protein